MLNKKGFLQISFGWLFAIIIGAIILFFAIYASVKLIGTEEQTAAAETGKEVAVLLNPLETGFGEEKTTPLSIPIESRINNRCDLFGDFGEQGIKPFLPCTPSLVRPCCFLAREPPALAGGVVTGLEMRFSASWSSGRKFGNEPLLVVLPDIIAAHVQVV